MLSRRIVLVALFLTLTGCTQHDSCPTTPETDDSNGVVHWVGEMKRTHAGDLSATIKLDSLQSLPHLYAIGPLEGMKGEISIFDSTPSIATVSEKKISTAATWNHAAPFLVYAQVSKWSDTPIFDETVKTTADLETFVARTAKNQGIDTTSPFPFLLKGSPALVKLHVVANDGYPQNSAVTRATFSIENKPVEIVGFYSEKHQGVFTHQGSNVHMHVRTADGTMSGHVDEIELNGGVMELCLPTNRAK